MNREREFEGKDLEAALSEASARLGIPEPDLDYQILEQGRRGLMGLGAKNVRILVMPPVSADEPAGKPVEDCQKQSVSLTLHRGKEDDQILVKEGAAAFRRSRIVELCQEALSQGGLLTCEDLAHSFF